MNLLRHSVLSAGLHRITAVIFALSLIFTLSAFASDFYTVDTVSNPRLENTSFHVSDPASLLTHDTVSYLNEKLTQLEKDTGIQSAVVVLPSVGDSDVFEFSQELFRKWGIGQRDKNDGLLLTYVEDQHIIRFHTGYGLEGVLPDAVCKRIQQQKMIPFFKEGKINEGMRAGIDSLYERLAAEGKSESDDESSVADSDDDDFLITLVTIIATVVLIFAVAAGVMLRNLFEKCPNCGRRKTLKKISEKERKKHHHTYLEEVKRCSYCGYEVKRSYKIDDDDDDNDSFLSGGTGGFSSSSGGSFGGGSSGGGGASSRW